MLILAETGRNEIECVPCCSRVKSGLGLILGDPCLNKVELKLESTKHVTRGSALAEPAYYV